MTIKKGGVLYGPWRNLEVPFQSKSSTKERLKELGMEVQELCPMSNKDAGRCVITYRQRLDSSVC